MNSTTIAVDLAKSVFEVAVSRHPGQVSERFRLSRGQFLEFFAQRQPATVLMEACGSAHHWGREIQALGHTVRLLPPHAVRPYVTRNKTDRCDAKGILESARNEDLRPVPVKSTAQQTLAALHRFRSAWMATRTARLNTLRGTLREFGVAIPVGSTRVVPRILELTGSDDPPIPQALHAPLMELCAEIENIDQLVCGIERQLRALSAQTPVTANLLSIPGVGLLNATALVGFVGDIHRFPSARHFASYLGLTPRESSSGKRRRLGAISKRGDSYLRMLLIHGARAILCHAKKQPEPDRLRAWALSVEKMRGHNKATVALANKLSRIVWACWKNGADYQARAAA